MAKAKEGEGACPFNLLYWNFMIENEARLRENRRIGMIYKTLDRMTPERKATIRREATAFLDTACGPLTVPDDARAAAE